MTKPTLFQASYRARSEELRPLLDQLAQHLDESAYPDSSKGFILNRMDRAIITARDLITAYEEEPNP